MHSILKERKIFGKPDAESLERNSQSSIHKVYATGTRKVRRLEKYKSNLDISEVPTLQNSRTGPMKRLKDNSDVPDARLGILPKTCTSSKKKTRLHSTHPRKNG